MKNLKLMLSILALKKSVFILLAFLVFLMSCTTDEKHWEDAKSRNTVEGYELFLSKYPESEYSQQALNAKAKLKGFQDPYFISWILEKSENELKELKKIDSLIYTLSNIEKWEILFNEWDKINEPFLTVIKTIGESTIFYTKGDKKIAEIKGNLLFYKIKGKEKKMNLIRSMYICFDKRGNIIIDENLNPVLVKSFSAQQRTEFKNEYDGAWLSKRITKIYPCRNCSEITGIKNCRFVW